ncbi:MAG: alanine--tRNA ligase [Chitinophagales bacterium]|nr:alanine--tRNA ligase [Chitinophagales bacterium]
MNKDQIRNTFLEFFKGKDHKIVPSAPIVIKNDPTLMFTNAGMNQFKEIFLDKKESSNARIADTQKCLRVSGKHNDLEEVGHDTYHHTMFEMLGNWSFGDYFKEDAINWAWELLTEIYNIPTDRLYATIFEGNDEDKLSQDDETLSFWKNHLPQERILAFSKKDNFWEMGDTGPCGPCSEIHVDLRSDEDRAKTDGALLVNKDHPQVIEVWNLVFIQFNRKKGGKLEELPNKHVDTGMGFERLCMVLQNTTSTYDTDVFQSLKDHVSKLCKIKYGEKEQTDIAIRVIIDHIRAIVFTIADGQMPSNTGAGYVIRRVLRRAVRYGFTYLNLKEPFLFKLVSDLSVDFESVFPEVKKQEELVSKVIHEEEISFLRTLESGLKRLDEIFKKDKSNEIPGSVAFELYDTYGFPLDLTQLIASEKNWKIDVEGFDLCMKEQKARSKADAEVDLSDWVVVREDDEQEFIGYDNLEVDVRITRYREVETKGKKIFHLIFNYTPFYAESGGQVGDTGILISGKEKIKILDTIKEHGEHIHIVNKLPESISDEFHVAVDKLRRTRTMYNHSGTHLLHAALKQVLGDHVEQKGSLVASDHLRFDFSHFSKMSDEEIEEVERIVNEKIRENILLEEKRNVPFKQAVAEGATALFGEKYGEIVRVITFDKDFSVELCGGTHVKATGEIGLLKIISESSIAAGVRRIEAYSGPKAFELFKHTVDELNQIQLLIKSQNKVKEAVESLLAENATLKRELEGMKNKQAQQIKVNLSSKIKSHGGFNYIIDEVEIDAEGIKNILFSLNREVDKLVAVLGSKSNDKVHLSILIDKNIAEEKDLNAGSWVKELAKEIKGGGGGQAHFASAGGSDPSGLKSALSKAEETISKI